MMLTSSKLLASAAPFCLGSPSAPKALSSNIRPDCGSELSSEQIQWTRFLTTDVRLKAPVKTRETRSPRIQMQHTTCILFSEGILSMAIDLVALDLLEGEIIASVNGSGRSKTPWFFHALSRSSAVSAALTPDSANHSRHAGSNFCTDTPPARYRISARVATTP